MAEAIGAKSAFDAALGAERFIASQRVEEEGRTTWRRADRRGARSVHTLYHGTAGIVLFYLELYKATGEGAYLETAKAGGDTLVDYVRTQESLSVGLYTGWPGYGHALNELAAATGIERYRDAAAHCVEQLRREATELGAGIGWIEPMPFSEITGHSGDREIYDLSAGAAGAGLFFLYAHDRGLNADALDSARLVAERLLDVAEETEDGPRWGLMSDMPFRFTAPNFAHGGAGVAFFLAKLYQATGEQRYLDTAIRGARYVESRAVKMGKGAHLVCHNEEEQPPRLFYLGVCHGPAGTGRLFYLLGQITDDAHWLEWLHAATRGLIETGAPEQRTKGLWNNVGQCCGDAGIGDYALNVFRATGDESHLELARRVGAELLQRSRDQDGGRAWPQAEHRTRPDFIEAQTGYMQGAAGIGSFFLHLAATLERTTPAKIALADSPFA